MMYRTRYRIMGISSYAIGYGAPKHLVVGEGNTKKSAWEDALGEKPWSSYQKSMARKYWIEDSVDEVPEPVVYVAEGQDPKAVYL